MSDFGAVTAVEGSTGRYSWVVPDRWQHGRGTYGGLVIASMIRALESEVDGERPIRAMNAILCGPTEVGRAEITVELLRSGSNATTLSATLRQDGTVRTHATAFFGRRRVDDGDWNELEPPPLGDWRADDVALVEPPLAPEFARHLEFRPVAGFPFAGESADEVLGWIRWQRPGSKRDPAFLAGLIDGYWPVRLCAETGPRPIMTVAFQIEFLGEFSGLDPEAPVYYRARAPASSDGFIVEFRELWGADGRLLALNQQSFCIVA